MKIDILDTLYGGFAGEFQQEFTLNDDSLIPDVKQSHTEESQTYVPQNVLPPEVVPSEEVFASLADPDFDIRPRVFCNATQSWYLVDSGSQVSVLKPSAGDKVNPNILLEAVNGTNMKCYGKNNIQLDLVEKHTT